VENIPWSRNLAQFLSRCLEIPQLCTMKGGQDSVGFVLHRAGNRHDSTWHDLSGPGIGYHGIYPPRAKQSRPLWKESLVRRSKLSSWHRQRRQQSGNRHLKHGQRCGGLTKAHSSARIQLRTGRIGLSHFYTRLVYRKATDVYDVVVTRGLRPLSMCS
jgi:hypothetical protein